MPKEQKKSIRPPVVVIMGHVDHGKSTLLDYIRKTNLTEREVGGITQKIAAYEAVHNDKTITFLDTPGHEAFSSLRERGSQVADIAILIVAVDDGVQPQTIEAIKVIQKNKLPFVVALNKIDKQGVDNQRTINQLIEHGVYLEGFGGDIPYTGISAKTGRGVLELLELILITADLNEVTANAENKASGTVIESHLDPRRGISATLIIKDGKIKKGDFVVADKAMAGTRIMESFLSKPIIEAEASSPIIITGFDALPKPGTIFETFESKKEAEQKIAINKEKEKEVELKTEIAEDVKIIPIIIKADFAGSIEAIEKELLKHKSETAVFKVIARGVGDVNENDIKLAAGNSDSIIAGFGVKAPKQIIEQSQKTNIEIAVFPIIYHLTDWLKEQLEKRRPKKEILESKGKAKILKIFKQESNRSVIGGEVIGGEIAANNILQIIRRNNVLGEAKIINLEKNKSKVPSVKGNEQFGMLIESKLELASSDILEGFEKKLV